MSVLSGKSVAILATDGFEQSELLVRGRLVKAGRSSVLRR